MAHLISPIEDAKIASIVLGEGVMNNSGFPCNISTALFKPFFSKVGAHELKLQLQKM